MKKKSIEDIRHIEISKLTYGWNVTVKGYIGEDYTEHRLGFSTTKSMLKLLSKIKDN